jgi:hypothetical protein
MTRVSLYSIKQRSPQTNNKPDRLCPHIKQRSPNSTKINYDRVDEI